jgi:hypothetical protein
MARPESVQIGPIRYRITDREDDWHAWEKDGNRQQRKMAGAAWNTKALILVNADDDVQQQRVTVLHEIIHALVDMFTSYKQPKDKETEEGWIGTIDAGLLDVLRRNPNLVTWLLETES